MASEMQVMQVMQGSAPSVDGLIRAWLHAKFQRSGSERTLEEYEAVLSDFRREVQRAGLDLDASDVQALGRWAQAWAARVRARDEQPVSGATHNRRLAIVSSFYVYAKRHGGVNTDGAPMANPTELVERMRVQNHAAARPLDFADVTARLQAIDRSDLLGKRDYALLSVALATGRRISELAALRVGDVSVSRGRALLVWRRTKGGKQMYDTLSTSTTDVLVEWLDAAYGTRSLLTLAPDMPSWLALGRNVPAGQRRALSIDAIADICKKRLGVSKVHTTRHTFAVAMEQAGAKLTDIQQQLGHANASITGVYLQRLHSGENAYADDLAVLFGIAPTPPAPRAAKTTRPLKRSRR